MFCYSNLADSARYYMQLALQAPAASTETHTWMLSAMREIARLEGNPAEALDFQMRYTRSRDSRSKVINNQDIKVIEANYQREEEAHETRVAMKEVFAPVQQAMDESIYLQWDAAYTRCSRLYKKLGVEVTRGRTPAFREIIIRMHQQTQVSM